MTGDFFHTLKLPPSPEQLRRLPRNAAYKYEILDGEAWLTPRPRWFHAVLDLTPLDAPKSVDAQGEVGLRPLRPDDWEQLVGCVLYERPDAVVFIDPLVPPDDDSFWHWPMSVSRNGRSLC